MNVRVIFVALIATLFAGFVMAAEPQTGQPSAQDDSVQGRSLSAIQDDLHDALRAEALTRRQGQNVSEVVRLVELYREMAAHPKRDNSLVLARMGLRLRSRLEKVSDHIERHSARQNRNAKKKELRADLAVPDTPVLAQQFAGAGGAGPGGAAPGAGGQGAGAGVGAGAGAGGIPDYGPDLVELIQATISPATWDINGGNGSIVYFAPLRVLVVSAPGTVHGEVGEVLGQLRAAP
jgi:hypothetical protein